VFHVPKMPPKSVWLASRALQLERCALCLASVHRALRRVCSPRGVGVACGVQADVCVRHAVAGDMRGRAGCRRGCGDGSSVTHCRSRRHVRACEGMCARVRVAETRCRSEMRTRLVSSRAALTLRDRCLRGCRAAITQITPRTLDRPNFVISRPATPTPST
jgi:hypothetical protein